MLGFHRSSHLILHMTPRRRPPLPHFTDEETEAHGGDMLFPRSGGLAPNHCSALPNEHVHSLQEEIGTDSEN